MRFPLFREDELRRLPPHTDLTKTDATSGRSATVYINPGHGTFVTITGSDVPGEAITVSCDGDHVDAVARALVTGSFK